MNDSDIRRRLTRLEHHYGVGAEIEDMRQVEIQIYGEKALGEIYQDEGIDSLKEIAEDSFFSEEEKAMIAAGVRAGDEWAMLKLWVRVKGFVSMKATRYLKAAHYDQRIEKDDLIQDGFIAMIDAAMIYDESKGAFQDALTYCLQKRFAEEGGHRTSKRDALREAESIDAPKNSDRPEEESRAQFILDPAGEYAFRLVDYAEYQDYCFRLIMTALFTLAPKQRARILEHHYYGRSVEMMSQEQGARREAIFFSIRTGLKKLRYGEYGPALHEALTGFEDFRDLQTERQRALELHAIAKKRAGD